MQFKLLETEDNYQRVTEEFNKTEEQLTTVRESDSQEMTIMVMTTLIICYMKQIFFFSLGNNKLIIQNCTYFIQEQDFNSKIEKLKDESIGLHNLLTELRKELENAKMELELKTDELHQTQDKCNNYSDQLDVLREKVCDALYVCLSFCYKRNIELYE